MSDELGFLEKLRENPGEETTRLVYADWLDEQGESKKASYLRALVEIRKQADIMKSLSKSISNDWLGLITEARQDEYDAYLLKKGLNYLPLSKVREWIKTDASNVNIEAIQTYKNIGTTITSDFNLLLGDTIRERYESLYLRLVEMFNMLIRKVPKVSNAWILSSPEISSIFETASAGFSPSSVYPEYFTEAEEDHPVYKGIVNNRWNLYSHTLFPQGIILMGVGKGEPTPQHLALLNLLNFTI